MRAIDADALKNSVLKWLPPDPCGQEEKEYPFETDICVSMMQEIEYAPTVEPRKGRWYKPTGMMPPEYAGVYRCSECDEMAMRDWKHHRQVLSNYCPNCGADMRGEQDG